MTDLDPTAAPGFSTSPEEPTQARGGEGRASPPVPPQLALITYAGEGLGAMKPLGPGEFLIGRSADCHIVAQDGEISRHHAAVRVSDGDPPRVVVRDLGSTNGTQVNGRTVRGSLELAPGDRLELGRHVYKLVVLDELERAFYQSLLDAGTRDCLTGLANRSAIMRELESRFHLAQRYRRPFSLILADLDHFKRINDCRGHTAGDAALSAFSQMLLAQLREPDLTGRIGGEEFLVLLPETDCEGAAVVAERLRAAAEAIQLEADGGPIRFTCSLGVAMVDPEDCEPGQAFARADAALYRAKAAGRNQVARG